MLSYTLHETFSNFLSQVTFAGEKYPITSNYILTLTPTQLFRGARKDKDKDEIKIKRKR